jgi:uncharacterized protein HemX
MKQTTKNILGVAAIVVLSAGVAGVTTYKMQNKEKSATFSELFQQNPNNLRLAATPRMFFVVCFILLSIFFNY